MSAPTASRLCQRPWARVPRLLPPWLTRASAPRVPETRPFRSASNHRRTRLTPPSQHRLDARQCDHTAIAAFSCGRIGRHVVYIHMLTVSSIGAAKGVGYARYLESKTIEPDRGDYYLSPDGEPMQAPGRWLTPPSTLAWLGIESEVVKGPDFIALMEGRHPRSGTWLRKQGANGVRGGGIDLTFSAPKSISAAWALGGSSVRADMEEAHAAAVAQAMDYLTEATPTVRRRHGGLVTEEHARALIAAEYRHTTARGVIAG